MANFAAKLAVVIGLEANGVVQGDSVDDIACELGICGIPTGQIKLALQSLHNAKIIRCARPRTGGVGDRRPYRVTSLTRR